MPGPYIDKIGANHDPMAKFYRDEFMPWVQGGGPGTWDRKIGTPPPKPPGGLKEDQYDALKKLLLAAFGGGAGSRRYDTWRNEAENRAAHGPGVWGLEETYLTP